MTRSPRRLREQVRDTVSDLPIQAARLAVMGVGRALLLTDRVRKDYREARESGLSPVLGRLKNDAENLTGMVVGKVAGNGQAPETPEKTPKSRPASDSEISVGKPKTTGTSRPAPRTRPTAAPPSRPSTTSRPKPAAAKPTPKPAPKPSAKPAAKPAPKPAAKATPAAAAEKPSAPAKPKPADTKPAPKPADAKTTPKPVTAKTTSKPADAKTTPKAADAKTTPKAAEAKTTSKPADAKTTSKPADAKPAARVKAGTDLPISGYDEATLASVRARLRGLDARQVGELRDYERANAARADFLRMYENRIAKIRGER